MKKYKFILLFISIIISQNLYSQTIGVVDKNYHNEIIFQEIPSKKLFKILSEYNLKHQKKDSINIDKSISKLPDSIINKYSLEEIRIKYTPFEHLNNRSRIYFDAYNEKIKLPKKEYLKKGMDLPCECFIQNDTLTITTGAGFFGGFGFISKIHNNSFQNYFYEYSEDSEIVIDSKYQKMVLEQKPKLKTVLTGYLSLFTNTYDGTKNTHGEVYFNCLVTKRE